jgi:hypothetical protein
MRFYSTNYEKHLVTSETYEANCVLAACAIEQEKNTAEHLPFHLVAQSKGVQIIVPGSNRDRG